MRRPSRTTTDPRALTVPENISLPQLQGDAEVLLIGTSHIYRSLVPLIASQLRALNITTLYIEAIGDSSVYAELSAGMTVPIHRLMRETGLGTSEIDLMLAAQMAGARVVGIDDMEERHRLDCAYDHGRDAETRDEYLRSLNDLCARRNKIMANNILRDRESRPRRNPAEGPERSLVFTGRNHLRQLRTSGHVSIDGIGQQLRTAGIAARDVFVFGELDPLEAANPDLHDHFDASGVDRLAATVCRDVDDPETWAICLPQHPVRLSTLAAVVDHWAWNPLTRLDPVIRLDLSDDDPNAAYLRGFAAHRRFDGRAAAKHFAEGVRLGEPLQNLDRARALVAPLDHAPAGPATEQQRTEAIAALSELIDAGVPGAARISAGFLHAMGHADQARALNLRADREEVDRGHLWTPDRVAERTALRERLRKEDPRPALLAPFRRGARRAAMPAPPPLPDGQSDQSMTGPSDVQRPSARRVDRGSSARQPGPTL